MFDLFCLSTFQTRFICIVDWHQNANMGLLRTEGTRRKCRAAKQSEQSSSFLVKPVLRAYVLLTSSY